MHKLCSCLLKFFTKHLTAVAVAIINQKFLDFFFLLQKMNLQCSMTTFWMTAEEGSLSKYAAYRLGNSMFCIWG